jgi:hypothetical protein
MKANPADTEDLVFECVELYVPKKLEHLSEIFTFLRNKLSEREQGVRQAVAIDGFSIYEVDGAFYGEKVYQERTLVIRILFKRSASEDGKSIREKTPRTWSRNCHYSCPDRRRILDLPLSAGRRDLSSGKP